MNAPVPGDRMTLFGRRTFSFSDLETSGTAEYVVARAVDVTDFGDATLIVRVHSKSIDNSAKIEVIVKSVAPSDDDPETNFVSSDQVASVEITSSEGDAGSVLVDPVIASFGGFLQIIVKGTQDSASADDCEAVLSAELGVAASSPTKPKIMGNLLPGTTLATSIGSSALRVKRSFFSHLASGVLMVSNEDATLGEQTFVQATAYGPSSTLTLPSADKGWWYVIDYSSIIDSAWVILTPTGSDTINGTNGDVYLPSGSYIFLVYSEDGQAWRAVGFSRDSLPP